MSKSLKADVHIAVVGAGISGLTAAHRLRQAGFRVTVFEKSALVGGRIQSFRRGEFLFDVGAFIYLGSYAESIALMKELGLGPRMGRFDAYGAMPRDGRLHYLDLRHPLRSVVGSKYLSAASKLKSLKLFRLLASHWKDLNYDDASGLADIDTDTVASYCRRELNEELLDYLASVVIRGPWLSDVERASVGQLLWTLKNFFKPYFYGLDEGMDALPRALAAGLDVRLEHRVLGVEDRGSEAELVWLSANGEHSERFDGVVITTTADHALSIYPQMRGPARELYESTEYIVSVNTHLALSKRPAEPATYIMVSPREHPDLCGVIVDHKKAAGRAPADKGMITVFCRHEWCQQNLHATDDAVLGQVLRFIRPYYGDLTDDVCDYAIGRWPQVVPIMGQGRFRRIAAYEKTLTSSATVQLAGDLDPIGGVNAALVSGERAARRIAERFR